MPDRNGKIFYTSITSLSHISKKPRHETAYFTACGQPAILENGDLAAALSRLSKHEQEELIAYYFQKKKQGEIAARYGRTRSTAGWHILIALRKLQEEMERCRHE